MDCLCNSLVAAWRTLWIPVLSNMRYLHMSLFCIYNLLLCNLNVYSSTVFLGQYAELNKRVFWWTKRSRHYKKIRLCWDRKNISQPASGSCNLNRLIVDLCLIFTKGKKNGEKRNQDRKWDTFRLYWSD